MQKKNYKKNTGFTIIETMIAISIFLIVIVIGMGALLNANLIHQKSRDMRSIMDNLSFVMEDISNNLRTGFEYRCFDSAGIINIGPPSDCDPGWAIVFKPQDYDSLSNPNEWGYYIDNGQIFKSTNVGDLNSFIPLTPIEIIIDQPYGFSVTGAPSGDNKQPFVTIRLVGHVEYKDITTPFSLQTSVSQRLIDI